MSDVVVFHHAKGLTEGVTHAGEVGFGTVMDRGRQAAEDLPAATVYVGISLGVLPAQLLAQTRTDQHLFIDESLPAYDPAAATQLTDRVLTYLAAL